MGNDAKSLHIPSLSGLLPNGWHWERLDTACDGIYDCPHSTPLLTDDGPFVARSQDIRSGVFRFDQAGRVTEDTYKERVTRAEPRYGDILYSREGTYFGIAAEVPSDVRVCLGQRMVLMRPKVSKCNSRYLRYWLNSPLMASHIQGHRDGTVAERLNLTTIRQLPVMVPPLREQCAIAHIIGTLDDRIELNRKMNETQEAMARALFKSWFVDFEPVRAKAEGRDTGLPSEIAELFPDSFRNSELGEVPRGWKDRRVEDALELAYGKALKASERVEGTVPVYGSGGITGYHNSALVKGPSIIVGRKGTVGSLYWEDEPFYPIDTVFYVKPNAPLTFCFYLLQTLGLENMNTDAAVPGLNRNNAYRLLFACPPVELQQAFDNIVKTIRKKIQSNAEHSRTVAALRDSLLPKLISGQIRVGEVDKMVEKTL